MAINDGLRLVYFSATKPVLGVQPTTIYDFARDTGNHAINASATNKITIGADYAVFDGTAYAQSRPLSMPWKLPTVGLTVRARFYLTNTTGSKTVVGVWDSSAANDRAWMLWVNGSTFTFSGSADGTAASSATKTGAVAATWYDVFGVWDGATVQVYVNDVAGTGAAFVGPPDPTSAASLTVGRQHTNAGVFGGRMEGVMVWDRALSAGEMTGVINGTARPILRPSSLERYILLPGGQSNTTGRALTSGITNPVAASRHYHNVWMGTNSGGDISIGNWSHVFPGHHATITEFGPEVGIAEVLSPLGGHWGVLKFAIGATGLDPLHVEWLNAGPVRGPTYASQKIYVDAALAELRAIGETPILISFPWIHGEKDSQFTTSADAYHSNGKILVGFVRSDFNSPHLRLIVPRLNDDQSGEFLSVVRAQQEAWVAGDGFARLLNTDGLTLIDEGINDYHYDSASQLALGRMIAYSTIEVADLQQVSSQPSLDVAQSVTLDVDDPLNLMLGYQHAKAIR